ncbi:MAG TPA: NADH-quinone oxidoreductase subunit J [Acidobacteriota bacterium]|nr:NADH-quinone oxidoreductase subunit J [Acidobacteriota bacterium]
MEIIAFYIIASIITVSAVLMVTSRELVHSIVYMVISFIGVGGLFILLQAEFVAAVQILVYAGGIVVLFLFVVMLVNLNEVNQVEYLHRQWLPAGAMLVALVAEIGYLLWGNAAGLAAAPEQAETVLRAVDQGNTETIGMTLYTEFLLPFEIASMLLLVAMIGAIYLAKKRV